MGQQTGQNHVGKRVRKIVEIDQRLQTEEVGQEKPDSSSGGTASRLHDETAMSSKEQQMN